VFRDELAHVITRRVAVVAQFQNLADLAEGEPHGLGGSDEPEPFQRSLVVVAIPGRGPCRRREEPDFFVVADGFGGDFDVVGQLPDSHESDDTT